MRLPTIEDLLIKQEPAQGQQSGKPDVADELPLSMLQTRRVAQGGPPQRSRRTLAITWPQKAEAEGSPKGVGNLRWRGR